MSADLALVRAREFLRHAAPGAHPERPERLLALDPLFAPGSPFASLPNIGLHFAGDEALGRTHAAELIARVVGVQGRAGWFDSDTYYAPSSAETALLAAGSTAELAVRIWRGDFRRGFALVRPPGHHATRDRIMGFCLLNNVAVAAAAVLSEHPQTRISIVDFDLHHGNGTQEIFYDNPQVFFLSSHRFPFYPGTGAQTERGRGKGLGTTVNFPLAERFDGFFFRRLYGEIALPLVDRFAPDFILVSAGFDGHERDPMEGFRITTPDYAWIAESLIALAEKRNGKILFCLEGGYDPPALAESVEAVLDRLVRCPREPFAPPPIPGVSDGAVELERFERAFRGN